MKRWNCRRSDRSDVPAAAAISPVVSGRARLRCMKRMAIATPRGAVLQALVDTSLGPVDCFIGYFPDTGLPPHASSTALDLPATLPQGSTLSWWVQHIATPSVHLVATVFHRRVTLKVAIRHHIVWRPAASRAVLSSGDRRCRAAECEAVSVAGIDQPCAAVARSGQAGGSPSSACSELQLVHRRFRCAGPEGCEGTAR
jgi:hypothetical protein